LATFSAPALQSTTGPVESVEGSPLAPFGVPTPITGGEVYVGHNPDLTGFGLSSLWKTSFVEVEYNESLATLPSLGPLSSGAGVGIYYNASLANLNGLATVTHLYDVVVKSNPALTSVTGLGALQEAWNLDFQSNNALTAWTMAGLQQVWNNVNIAVHDALASVSFPNLLTVGAGTGAHPTRGSLALSSNPLLTNATFSALSTLDSRLFVQNTALTSLSGFSALRSPVYGIYVNTNPALTSVSGLSGIGATFANPAVANAFQIINNPQLCSDNVASLVSAIQARGAGAFANPPVNAGNKSCGTQQED